MIEISFDNPEKAIQEMYSAIEQRGRYEKVNATIIYKDGQKEKTRFGLWGTDGIFKYGKGRRRYGHTLSANNWRIENFETVKLSEPRQKSKQEVWRKSWERVLGYLDESGLIPSYRDNVKLALEIGYDKIQKALDVDCQYSLGREERVSQVKEIIPCIVHTNKEGEEYYSTEIIWYMSRPAKIKTMYFGKYRTKEIRENLANALENKEPYSDYQEAGYDVSVSYEPARDTISYNEEYRGCGNGHYYIGLNATHAVHYEDD